MKPNYDKLNFNRSMTDQEGGFITSDICHNYGIMSGCDEGCPALLSGECRNVGDAIESCDIDEETRLEILSLYQSNPIHKPDHPRPDEQTVSGFPIDMAGHSRAQGADESGKTQWF